MTATQGPLFAPGWEQQEPDADERAHADIHGPPQRRTRLSARELKWLGDHETVDVVGGVL